MIEAIEWCIFSVIYGSLDPSEIVLIAVRQPKCFDSMKHFFTIISFLLAADFVAGSGLPPKAPIKVESQPLPASHPILKDFSSSFHHEPYLLLKETLKKLQMERFQAQQSAGEELVQIEQLERDAARLNSQPTNEHTSKEIARIVQTIEQQQDRASARLATFVELGSRIDRVKTAISRHPESVSDMKVVDFWPMWRRDRPAQRQSNSAIV